MSRFRTAALAVLVLVTGVLAAPAATATSSRDSVAAVRPAVGQCRALTLERLNRQSDTGPTVPCSGPHTALTYGVPKLPTGVKYGDLTINEIAAQAFRLCGSRYAAKLGGTLALRDQTVYSYGWWIPTRAERAAGARWMRCDLLLISNNQLKQLPAASANTPVLSGPLTDDIRRCLKVPRARAIDVSCSTPHTYRPFKAFYFQHSGYPTTAQFVNAGTRRCPNADYFSWAYEYVWNRGDHIVICYRRTAT